MKAEEAAVAAKEAAARLEALEALAEVAGGRPVLSTGDLVAYGGAPAETVARFRALGWPGIAGNCERQIAAGAADCGCGFDADSACDRMAGAWYPFAAGAVDAGARDWMSALPDIGVFAQGGRRYGDGAAATARASRPTWSRWRRRPGTRRRCSTRATARTTRTTRQA